MTTDPAARERAVAIIGAGPSGLFAAQALTNQDEIPLHIDIYDRMPTPYGLLRYGVAPDHTSIKGIATALAKVFSSDKISFVGMVELGRDVTRDELLAAYDAVIYAAGASEDQRMHIPGESLPGSRSAREFVAWYSGHPDAPPVDMNDVSTAVTVGVGNVAVDCARILTKTASQLADTDMPEGVLQGLYGHRIRDVWVIGRRGPQHASFTTPELRELVEREDVAVEVAPGAFDGIVEDELDRRTRANVAALREAAARVVRFPRTRLHFLFWHRPVALEGDGRVERMVLERTVVGADGQVVGTGEQTTIETQLVLRAIGYRGKPLPGVPFDEQRGIIPNREGRVCDDSGRELPHEYVVGWIKRGPIGVIGTNKSDAAETVRQVLADLATPRPDALVNLREMLAARGIRASSLADWQRIDAAEISLGQSTGRARTKIEAWQELQDLLRHGRGGGPPTPGDGDDGPPTP